MSPRAYRFLLFLLVLSTVVAALIAWPFIEAFLFAAVIGATMHPLYKRLNARLRGHRTLAAGLMTVAVLFAVLLPVAGLAAFVVREILAVSHSVAQTLRTEGAAGLVHSLPGPLGRWGERLAARYPDALNSLQSSLVSGSGRAAVMFGGLVQATGGLLLQAVMMLIALFFFLLDGATLVQWLVSLSPLGPVRTHELFAEFRRVSVAVLVSTVATAGVQALAALIGYLIVGAPNPVFLALVTFFVAFIPAIGAASVGVVTALYLLLSGHLIGGSVLLLWSLLVVGLVDNVVKPYLIRGGIEIHGGIVFFALLGGLAAFGPVGLVVGPLAISFWLALLGIYRSEAQPAADDNGAALSESRPARQEDEHRSPH